MRNRKPDILAIGVFFLLSLLYCHRFLGTYCIETDFIANITYRLNEAQLRLDYNPYQWDYASWMPFVGLENPIIKLITELVTLFKPQASEVAKSFIINFLLSWFLLGLFSTSVFLFLRFCGRTVLGALCGSLLVGYTGFQLTGIRLLNHMYLMSFCAVCPVWYCFIQISQNCKVKLYVILAALIIGTSLLGGSNSPLFYYMPFLSLIPLIQFWRKRKTSSLEQLGNGIKWNLVACVLSLFIGAAIVFPGLAFLGDTNRVYLKFIDEKYNLTALELLRSVFFRDWVWNRGTGYYESDCFLGLTGIFLVAIGLWNRWRHQERRFDLVEEVSLLCLIAGLIALNLHQFPQVVVNGLSRVFEVMSIRNSSRFYMLAAIPLGYWAAKGFDLTERKLYLRFALGSLALGIMLFAFLVQPHWIQMAAASRIACVTSIVFGGVALLLMGIRSWNKVWRTRIAVSSLAFLFLSLYYAPVPQTNYPIRLTGFKVNKKEISEFFNLKGEYAEILSTLDKYLLHPPKYLQNRESYKGRIWDPMEETVLRTNYFATRTRHRLAFSSVYDFASSKRLAEYFGNKTDAMLDLYGVCSEVKRQGERTWMQSRKHCLPEAFLVSRLNSFSLDEEVLKWMRNQSTADLSKAAAIKCADKHSCKGIPVELFAEEAPKEKGPLVERLEKGAQHLNFKVKPRVPSMLFLSVPYRNDWIAKVDGARTEVFRVNHAFIGVPVGEGPKQVQLFLENRVLYYSRKCTEITYVLFLLSLAYFYWREKKVEWIQWMKKNPTLIPQSNI